MKFQFVRASSAEEIQNAVTGFDVLIVNSSVSQSANPGLAKDIVEYGMATNVLSDVVPYFIDPERVESSKVFYEAKLSDFETKYAELAGSDQRIGILNSRVNNSVIDFSPADQTITVSGGISIRKLNKLLAESGQCIPLPVFNPRESTLLSPIETSGSVDRQIYVNRPHLLESQCGSWRDWVLGMKIVLANGEVVTAGSKVVKNVAGFDLHKLMIGSHGTLGVIAEVTLRTFPLRNLPQPNVQQFPRFENPTGGARKMYTWIQRVPVSDLSSAIKATQPYVREVDLNTGTLWGLAPIEVDIPLPSGGWMIRNRSGVQNLRIDNPIQVALMKRAKAIFDPTNKLNPGVFGFI